ncbi:FUSC family protein [Microbacterium yannicii]|uniref:FUSC family protein n=1 Tax=Microbacterium yannicii TaxID=671622 RepID=UPI0002D7514C|nr:FUSC family protein [Microbacterium yannicii]
MDVVWVVVGVVLLLVTLLDAFLAVLNYDESGLFVDRIVRLQWLVLRAITRRVGRRWRPVVLRQVTGVLIIVTILWWVVGIVLGFTFIYLGAMGMSGALVTSAGVEPDFLGAFYLSLGQFATVGVDNIGPGAAVMNIVTVAEAMISVVLLSFIITFLGSVYGVIQSLQSLSANFFRAGRGITDPIDSLAPFFPEGRPRGLEGQLDSILTSLSAYGDGLAQNRAAYYFQSGRDQFSLPFSLSMTAGVIGALRWGLPTGSEPSTEPGVIRLTEVFEDFRVRVEQALRWSTGPVPAPVTATQFDDAVSGFPAPASRNGLDPWVARFLRIDRRMAALTRSDAAIDPADAYRRYLAWLPFEFQAQSLLAAVSRDLDYQPIYRRIARTADGIPLDAVDGGYELLPMDMVDATPAPVDLAPRRAGPVAEWLRQRRLFIDPGLVRFTGALRVMAGVVVAIGIVVPLALLTGTDALYGSVLAGLIALFASPATIGSPSATRRWIGIVAVLPTAIGVTVGTVLPRDPVVTVVAIAVVAAAAVWLRRYGTRAGGLGQLGFIAFYFALLLGLHVRDLPGALIAAGIGLVCSWGANLLPGTASRRRIDPGIVAVYVRLGLLLETMVDLVSTGRRDPRLVRALRRRQEAVQRTAGVIAGQLDDADASALTSTRAQALRVRVFDVQLAAQNLAAIVPITQGVAITIEQRAQLAADLVSVQEHLRALPGADATTSAVRTDGDDDEIPEEWPPDVRRMRAAALDLRATADRLHTLKDADEAAADTAESVGAADPAPVVGLDDTGGDTAGHRPAAAASGRQALQAGVSTGLALLLGSLVSTSHQYWAAMPAFGVLSGSDGETRLKALQRILATLAGAAIAFGLAIFAGHSVAVAFPLLVVSVFFIAFLRPISSTWTAFWQTLLLATMYDVLGTLSVETVQIRVVETAIGALVAVTVSALLLPTRTRRRVLDGMADVVRLAGSTAHDVFARAGDGGAAGLREAARRLTVLEEVARPVRGNAGSLQPTGIEAQFTALWSVLYYLRRAADRDDGPGLVGLTDTDLAALDRATADNVAAVEAVLAGDLPARVQDPADLDGVGAQSRHARVFVLYAVRLNQALLALIEAVKPGTVDAMTAAHPTADPRAAAAAAPKR